MSQQFITLTPIISDISATVSDNTIIGFINENDNSIKTTAVFSTDITREFSISPVSINSTIVFSTDIQSEFLFTVGDVINVQSFGDIGLDRDIDSNAIEPTANFGLSQLFGLGQLDRDLIANSVEPATQFSENVFFDYLIGQLNLLTIEPTTTFGEPALDSFILPIAIDSTEIVPNLTAFVSIGPDSIPSGLTFGQPTFNNPVHRSLIFKDDKITKLGTNDDVEVASGVVIKTSTAQLTGSSVPGSAAGYITVTINGTDFAVPLFNLDDV